MDKHQNRNYGKLENGVLTYAPKAITIAKQIILHPTKEEYASLGWLPIVDELPPDFDTPDNTHYVAKGWEVIDGEIQRVYEAVEDPPRPVMVSKAKVEAVIDEMGKTAEFFAWLNSKAAYVGGWMRGGNMVVYNPQANESDLTSLIGALGIAAEDVPGLIEKVRM